MMKKKKKIEQGGKKKAPAWQVEVEHVLLASTQLVV